MSSGAAGFRLLSLRDWPESSIRPLPVGRRGGVMLAGSMVIWGGNWYDGANNVIKANEAGKTSFSKSVFDGMDRLQVRYEVRVPGTAGGGGKQRPRRQFLRVGLGRLEPHRGSQARRRQRRQVWL